MNSESEIVFDKLYKKGKNKIQKKNKSYDSRSFFNNSDNNSIEINRPRSNSNRSVNMNKITYLYKDYKNKDIRAKEIREKMEKDDGISFKPISYTTNSNVKVRTTFRERNLKSLHGKTKNESSIDISKGEFSCSKAEEISNIRTALMKKFYSASKFPSKEKDSLPIQIKPYESKSSFKSIPVNKNICSVATESPDINSLNNTIIKSVQVHKEESKIVEKEMNWSFHCKDQPQTDRARNVNLNLPKQTSLSNETEHINTAQAASTNLNRYKKNFGHLINC